MGASLALLICTIGIAGLFFLDRDKSVSNSKALWVPVLWLWIVGSRPVSAWLAIGSGSSQSGIDATLDGNPVEAFIFEFLIAIAIAVLIRRNKQTKAFLKVSGPILLFLLYCLISTTWSPYPVSAFKRWTKDVGDLAMVLVILTDPQPMAALRRVFSRLGFFVFPFSIALIRYTDLGRAYDPDGGVMNTGVTQNKNTLGLITFTLALGALWNVRALVMDKSAPNRGRRLVAQGTLLVFGLVVLEMAHSATSVACFALGALLMLVTGLRVIGSRPARVQAVCLTIVFAGGLAFLSGVGANVSQALGRGTDLTGRTEIWAAAIPAVPNTLIGAGYESFWNGYGHIVTRKLEEQGYFNIRNLVSAHNGYIQIYLDLGWVGICMIAVILISGYRRACAAFRCNPEFGSLALAYIATAAIYSITEAGFRVMTPTWIFLQLAVVGASGAVAGLLDSKAEEPLQNLSAFRNSPERRGQHLRLPVPGWRGQ
jgi:exopolysaccharide production protein ExoQ